MLLEKMISHFTDFTDSDRSASAAQRVAPSHARARRAILLAVLAAALAVPASASARGRRAPELPERKPSEWFNSRPLTLASLRGRVVLLEIWTFG